MNILLLPTTAKSRAFHRYVTLVVVLFFTMYSKAHPLFETSGRIATLDNINLSNDTPLQKITSGLKAAVKHPFDEQLATDQNSSLFTRNLALGRSSAWELSLESFVALNKNMPGVNGKDFLVNLDIFERELIAGLASANVDKVAAEQDLWLDDVTMAVETTSTGRASIPEPTTLMLVSIGILGLFLHRRRTNWGTH